jgi:hypothetical protein
MALLGLLAYALLSGALFLSDGFFSPVALALVLAALALTGAAALWARAPRARDRLLFALLAALVLLQLAGLAARRAGWYLVPDASPTIPRACAIGAALLTLSYLRPARRRLANLRLVAFGALQVALTLWLVRVSPSPTIDVWHLQERAADLVVHGRNPYTATYPNVYGDLRFYSPEALREGAVQGFPYPPASLLLAVPGRLLGDVRYSLSAALVATFLLFVATGRRLGLPPGHPAELAAVAFLLHARGLFLLEQAWTDPFLLLAAAACVYAIVCGRARWLALAAFLGMKQYAILWLPGLARGAGLRAREIVLALLAAAALALPFALPNPRAFTWAVVQFHFKQPFRDFVLSVPAAVVRAGGPVLPGALGFGVALALIVLTARRRASSPSRALFGGACVLLGFFAFGKQAAFNYYWFVGGFLLLGVITSIGEEAAAQRRPMP